MIKVKSLKAKGKNYEIIITNKTKDKTFLVSSDLIVEYRLLADKEISEKEYQVLEKAIDRDGNYQKVLRFSLFKPRTEKEVFAYLLKNKIDDASYYLAKLKKQRIIDDETYLLNFINEAINYQRIGRIKITKDLEAKGIKTMDFNQALAEYSEKEQNDNLIFWLEKKVKTLGNKPFYQNQKTLIAFLLNKGFEYELIQQNLKTLEQEIRAKTNEQVLLEKEVKLLISKYQRTSKKMSLKQYLTNKLMQKGFAYQELKSYLEGSKFDE